jgi:hypothetical protein
MLIFGKQWISLVLVGIGATCSVGEGLEYGSISKTAAAAAYRLLRFTFQELRVADAGSNTRSITILCHIMPLLLFTYGLGAVVTHTKTRESISYCTALSWMIVAAGSCGAIEVKIKAIISLCMHHVSLPRLSLEAGTIRLSASSRGGGHSW